MSEINISVIIPAYNSEQTIYRALESVYSQTYRPIEIIIINDASKDKTEELIKGIDKQIETSFITNTSNQGPSTSRNIGISRTKGNWIAFLDADDFWHPQKLEIQVQIIKKTGTKLIGGIASIQSEKMSSLTSDNIHIKEISPHNMLWKNYFQTPSVLTIKDEDLKFDPSLSHAEDFDLWTKLIRKHGFGIATSPALINLGKEPYIKTGLSSALFKMEIGELKVLSQEKNVILRLAASTFSILKFLRRIIISKLKFYL